MTNKMKVRLQEQDELWRLRWANLSVWLFTIMFACMDCYILRSTINLLFTDSKYMVTFSALVCAAVLDVPLAIMGKAWKERDTGEKSPRETRKITVMCLLPFVLMLVISLWVRVSARDILYGNAGGADSGLVDLAAVSAQVSGDNDWFSIVCAIFMGLLPLVTSLASLGIGYWFTNPQREKVFRLQIQRLSLLEAIAGINAAMAECGDIEAEQQRAEEREEALYHTFLEQIDNKTDELKQLARLLLMEKVKQPDAITILTGQAQTVLAQGAKRGEEKLTIYTPKHSA